EGRAAAPLAAMRHRGGASLASLGLARHELAVLDMGRNIGRARRRAAPLRQHDETADHQHQRRDHQPSDAGQAPRLRMQHARLGGPEKDGVDQEWRQKQSDFGEDGADHRSQVPDEDVSASPRCRALRERKATSTRPGAERKNRHAQYYNEGAAAWRLRRRSSLARSGIDTGRANVSRHAYPRPETRASRASPPINPLVQVPQNPRGHPPNVALAERHGVVLPCHTLPVAAVERVVLRVHEEGERDLEGVGAFALAQHELVVGVNARDRRQNTVAGEGEVKVEVADRVDERAGEPDLLRRLAQGGIGRGTILRFDLAAGKRDLSWMAWKLGAHGKHPRGLTPVARRTEPRRRPRRLHAGLLPHRGIEIEIAARGLNRRVVERGRHVEGEPRAGAAEEVVARRTARQRRIHHMKYRRLAAGAMAKNFPAEATPELRAPTRSRSSPRSSSTSITARVTLAQRLRRTWR